MIRTFILFLLLAFVAPIHRPCSGQDRDRPLRAGEPVATFSRAGRLAVSPDGHIFITDRNRNTLLVFSADGALLETIGGPGTDEGQFDDPMDVDAGIGLIISVADRQNGRVQRFSKDFRFLESLPVTSDAGAYQEGGNPSFRTGEAGLQASANGLPVAVTTSNADDLYVVDEQIGVVHRWDRERRSRWIIGAEDSGPGALDQPVDVLTTAAYLFVADEGCSCVVYYDLFGTFIRRLAENALAGIKALEVSPGGFMAVMSDRIVEFTVEGTQIREISVGLDSELVDASFAGSALLLLTEKALYVRSN